MSVNVWAAISSTGTAEIRQALTDDEYSGPVTDTEQKIFRRMADFATVERMFKKPTVAGKVWHLFSLNFDGTTKARDALDWLEANRANHFVIVGAWWWDGRQVGTQWETDQDGNRTGNTTGTPLYPIHPRLIDFMPDDPVYDGNGDLTGYQAATQLTDVNLIQGQAPRRFT